MRLVTWNVNSLRARLPRVLELLADHRPDVVCLQETKVDAASFPHAELASAGYLAVERSEGRWNGVALLVPEGREVTDVARDLAGEPSPAEARWIEATVDGVRVASAYVPNGRELDHPMFVEKLAFLDAMAARVATLAAAGPVVVAGDFNVAPEDRDVWDPAQFVGATHVTPQERAGLAGVLAAGVRDAFRAVDPEAGAEGFTWWDYRGGAFHRRHGLRIDLVLASADLDVAACVVDTVYRRNNAAGDKPSDHAPVVAGLTRR
jgi:exodeoxyribonuclease III